MKFLGSTAMSMGRAEGLDLLVPTLMAPRAHSSGHSDAGGAWGINRQRPFEPIRKGTYENYDRRWARP